MTAAPSSFVALLGVIILVVVIATDIVFAVDRLPGNTYSELIIQAARYFVIIPTACGVVAGHWFLTLGTQRPPFGLGILIAVGVGLALVDHLSDHWLASHTHAAQWFLLGCALGSTLWSMEG